MASERTTREAAIDETIARTAIQALLDAYVDVVNRRQWGELSALFLPDARIELATLNRGPLVLVGPEALGRFIGDFVARLAFFQFVPLSSRLELRLDEDGALGRHFISEYRWDEAGDRFTRVFGVYRDRYRRIDGRWLFAHRAFEPLLSTSAAGSDLGVVGYPIEPTRFLASDD
ncbi:MAG: nuclear transport factor 2 family protein [Myxococcota bacterium]